MALLFSGWLISNAAFVVSALFLYRLTRVVLQDDEMARVSTLLYCFNPASVFMSSLYTESIFAMFTFGALFYLYTSREVIAVLFFMMATSTRSNGILAVGYIGWNVFLYIGKKYYSGISVKNVIHSVMKTMMGIIYVALIVSPYVGIQYYGYVLYCSDNPRPWCSKRIPSIYSFVQDFYWQNGSLFGYFQVKQIPNFVLASPLVAISAFGIISYVKKMMNRKLTGNGFYSPQVFVFIVHWGFITIFSILMTHIQTFTRFACCQCAPIFWFSSTQIIKKPGKWTTKLLLAYFGIYFIIGSILFSNFYPWT
eukprot:TRINITY_DN7047_c0_g1_i5.p1 TRINITY_DN7047_c0_g1~~TRINITY_DN7047_c0_g1_i5.p1  ORF type:complete len:309 (-),score=24.56 TRINITY_DN7047_c0_g1_i5:675-1601(-)